MSSNGMLAPGGADGAGGGGTERRNELLGGEASVNNIQCSL